MMDAKELVKCFGQPGLLAHLVAERDTILRALSLLAAAEASDGTTLETDALMLKHLTELVWPRDPRLVPDAYDLAQSIEAKHYRELRDHASRLERERNGLAAEVLRMVRLLNDNPNAYCSDIVACLNDEAKADKVKP